MALSARNNLKGEVVDVLLGTVTALVTVKGQQHNRISHH
jgi:molybdopterin-binding protein